jgi:hypothetical protein
VSYDISEKNGQIAHLDQDPSNCVEDNLAFMCLNHHSLYDSTTSQHRNYTIAEVKIGRAKLYEVVTQQKHDTAGEPYRVITNWEVRYPGGLSDVSIVRHGQHASLERFAIGENFTLINDSPHQVSIRVIFLIVYGCTQLAADPYSVHLPEWPRLLKAFGISQKTQLLFPLNLPDRSAIEGHILIPIRPDGQGKGVGGDVPQERQYLFEFEDLLTKRRSRLAASAASAPDKNCHQRCSNTDLARPGPKQEPFDID